MKQRKENQECWAVAILNKVGVGLIEKLTFWQKLAGDLVWVFQAEGKANATGACPVCLSKSKQASVSAAVSHG